MNSELRMPVGIEQVVKKSFGKQIEKHCTIQLGAHKMALWLFFIQNTYFCEGLECSKYAFQGMEF